ncbi:unnamed protein product [Closterium sp. Naga37s-1]|nr:unnamed protein product [Closterium sp. Naga37s-1]
MRGGRPIPARNTPISDHRPAPTNLPCLLRHRASRRARCPSARHHSLARAAIVLRNSPLAPTPPVQRGFFRPSLPPISFRPSLPPISFPPFLSPPSFPLLSPLLPPSFPPPFPSLSPSFPPPLPLLSPSFPPHFPLLTPSALLRLCRICLFPPPFPPPSSLFPLLSPSSSFCPPFPFLPASLFPPFSPSLNPLPPACAPPPPMPRCRRHSGRRATAWAPPSAAGRHAGEATASPLMHAPLLPPSLPLLRPPFPLSLPQFLSFLPPAQSFLPPSFPPLFPSVPPASPLPSPSFFPPFPLRPHPSPSFPLLSSDTSPSLLLYPPFTLLLHPPFPLLPPLCSAPFPHAAPSLPPACPAVCSQGASAAEEGRGGHRLLFLCPSPPFPSFLRSLLPPFPAFLRCLPPAAALQATGVQAACREGGSGEAGRRGVYGAHHSPCHHTCCSSAPPSYRLPTPPPPAALHVILPSFMAAPICVLLSSQGRHGRRGRAASAALDVLRGGLTAASACTALTSLCGTTHFGRGIRLAPSTRRLGAPLLLGLGMRDGGATDLVSAALVRPPDGLDTHATNARDSDAADSDAADSDAADSVAAD